MIMSDPERFLRQATEIIRVLSQEGHRHARRRRKRNKRRARRVLLGVLLMVVATFVIVPAMIAAGFLLGPRGVEGLIAAPILLFVTWAAIAYFTFRTRPSQRLLLKADLSALPAETEEWIEQERRHLPWPAQNQLDQIAGKVEALTPQVQGLDAQTPAGAELKRLLAEELPLLVRGYRKVPKALVEEPLYGGPSPERQLIEGLETIDKQLSRLHERLAKDDMHALATHQRYLDLKYNRNDEE